MSANPAAAIGASTSDSSFQVKTPLLLIVGWVTTVMAWWALAFYPVSQETPGWIALAREVCFGTTPTSGLPSAYGWILLFGGPALFLAVIFAAFGEDLRGLRAELRKSFRLRAAAFLLLSAFAWEAAWISVAIQKSVAGLESWDSSKSTGLGALPTAYPKLDQKPPEFNLQTQSGAAFGNKQLNGKVSILTFVFAHCQTMCPTLLKQTHDALARLNPATVQGVFFTL
ncbi:MAG: SCO family protein, partial [Bdellovibrionota bacterium]